MRSAFGIIELASSAPRRPAVYRARRSNGRRSLPANIYNAHGRTGGTGRGRGASALRAAVLIERRKGIRSLPPSPVPRESLEDRDHDRRARDAQSRSFICRYPSRRMPSPRLAPPRSSTILEITSASLSRARTRFSSGPRVSASANAPPSLQRVFLRRRGRGRGGNQFWASGRRLTAIRACTSGCPRRRISMFRNLRG